MEVVQAQPMSIETIAVVKTDAAGKIAIRKHRLKAVSMESPIANGWRILKKTTLLQWETGKAQIKIRREYHWNHID